MNDDFRFDLPSADVDEVTAERVRRAARSALAEASAPGLPARAARAVRRMEPVVAGVAAAVYTAWALGRLLVG